VQTVEIRLGCNGCVILKLATGPVIKPGTSRMQSSWVWIAVVMYFAYDAPFYNDFSVCTDLKIIYMRFGILKVVTESFCPLGCHAL